ncbi:hypothetical protein [Naasia lichenicola]|uniref:Uncharacterized protein n=1 Tax=Naasia lichenicola TaxID=2565933 RepID=A0A4S4FR61_9MICO|nr:hypothetical protein [Naasia lichenicola]THG33090.1 hypothetical protein E6C64_01645 [Naasia lichenicola]
MIVIVGLSLSACAASPGQAEGGSESKTSDGSDSTLSTAVDPQAADDGVPLDSGASGCASIPGFSSFADSADAFEAVIGFSIPEADCYALSPDDPSGVEGTAVYITKDVGLVAELRAAGEAAGWTSTDSTETSVTLMEGEAKAIRVDAFDATEADGSTPAFPQGVVVTYFSAE